MKFILPLVHTTNQHILTLGYQHYISTEVIDCSGISVEARKYKIIN